MPHVRHHAYYPATNISKAATYDMSDSRVVNLSGRVVPMVYRYIGNEALKANVFGRCANLEGITPVMYPRLTWDVEYQPLFWAVCSPKSVLESSSKVSPARK